MKNCNKRLLAAALALCITAGFVPAQAIKDESSPVLSASVVPARLPTEETAEFTSPPVLSGSCKVPFPEAV